MKNPPLGLKMIDSGPPDGTGNDFKVGAERIVEGKEKKRMKTESMDIFSGLKMSAINYYLQYNEPMRKTCPVIYSHILKGLAS